MYSEPVMTHYYLPFAKNTYFVGRRDELHQLNTRLLVDKDCQKITLAGLGGTGKTQIALEFAYTIKKTNPEFSIFWMPVLSIESFEKACTDIARLLEIPQTAVEQEDPKESVRKYLSMAQRRQWLLIVDNADDPDIVFGRERMKGIVDYLPGGDSGMVIFTTRTSGVATRLTRGDVIEVEAMSRQDAADFLGKSLIRKELLQDNAATTELLDELTCLPLALAQAAAYLNENRLTLAQYLWLLKNTEQDIISLMSREFRDDTRYKDSANAVATTWVVSFTQIQAQDTVAADLLSFMSCIEWKAIPHSILPTVQPRERMQRAIGTLCSFSFLQIATRDDEDWYDIHRLVHLATRIWMSQYDNISKVVTNAVRHIAEIFPHKEYENRAGIKAYLPHALRLLGDEQGINADQRSKLCLRVGICLQPNGRFQEAETLFEESCQLRSGLDEKHPDRLSSQHYLGTAYYHTGRIKKSLELLEHVVEIRKRVLPEYHPSRLASQHQLAMTYGSLGQIKRSIEILEHVVAIEEKVPPKDQYRLSAQGTLAVAYVEDGQIKKAIRLLERVAAVQNMLSEEHPRRLATQNELGKAYLANRQNKRQ